jgi:hypothetical protein
MAAAIKTAISTVGRTKRAPDLTSTQVFDEHMTSPPIAGVPEEFRKLSRFFLVIVLVPRSAVREKAGHKQSGTSLRAALLCRTPTYGVNGGGTSKTASLPYSLG